MASEGSDKPALKSSLRELLAKRSSIKGQITKFKNYLDKVCSLKEISTIELAELDLKLNKFQGLSARFDNIQSEIEVINSSSIDSELDERERIEHDIVQYIAIAKTELQKYTIDDDSKRRQSIMIHADSDHQNISFRLPKIQISKFDGSYFRWLEFRDTYVSLVHKNDRIQDIHKFHYLVSYLEGDAARIICNLEISSANYKEAWNLVCERYDNERILIDYHLDSLFNVHQLTRESDKSLRYLVDNITKNLRALNSLGLSTDNPACDYMVIFLLSAKLDNRTTQKWQEFRNTLGKIPNLDQFKKFLIDRANVLESLIRNKSLNNYNNSPKQTQSSNSSTSNNKSINKSSRFQNTNLFASPSTSQASNNTSKVYLCVVCNGNHRIYNCPEFQSKSIAERIACVSKYKLCKNCLRQGHPASECSMGSCRQCNQRHNSLLHDPSVSAHCTSGTTDDSNIETVAAFSRQKNQYVLLSTAIVEVYNSINNKSEKVRALLDSGSQSSFITKALQQKLGLKCNTINPLNVIGIGNNKCDKVIETCNTYLKSIQGTYQINLSCYILHQLTGDIPKVPVDIHNLKIPKDIVLADPKFNEPAPVDMLIGADVFWDILVGEQRSLGPNNPKLQNSKLGWIIAGPINSQNFIHNTQCNHATISNNELHDMLTRFWEIESLPQRRILSPNEIACENHFLNNTFRLSNGRFCVRLPLKESPNCLGDSYNQAKKRLLNLEKRFRKNPTLKSQYVEFIREYSELGHLSESPISIPNPSYFLGHHAVFKEDSESTKIRVVFDGSAPTASGYSLNDILMIGPNLQNSLFSILVRARQYKYILTGDIAKMYRQIAVAQEDCNLQLILWREDESHPIQTLRLGTVTYGTASASYLSTKCLWQVGEECDDELIKTIIQNDFLVDDVITGSDSESQLIYIQKALTTILNSACFPLRKFKTNLPELFHNIVEINTKDKLTLSESSNTLGLGWDPENDTFHIPVKIKSINSNDLITKRFITSQSFKIFDPLGLISPCIIQAKILIQKLWRKDIDWDQPVPDDLKENWYEISKNLPLLAKLHISRKVICDSPKFIELHSFCDASQVAYGACIYMRSLNENNEATVRLLCSKSKVAPVKPTTIPRLELCAALLAANLCKSVTDSLRVTPSKITHWCDSNVVLCWINNDPSKLKTFVANRTSEILDLTDRKSWRYVPTDANPADLISRGVNACQLHDNTMWWQGPSYLYSDESQWPILNPNKSSDLLEIKAHYINLPESSFDFKDFSNFTKLQRVFAYILRFLHNSKQSNKHNKLSGFLTVNELNNAFNFICRVVQKQSFSSEYKILLANKLLSSKSKLLSLSPFFDSTAQLIRVGGRLDNSDYSFNKKHPVLLDSSHYVTKLYFIREHIKHLHAGPQLLLAIVRESVWPINGRKLARRVVNQCFTCVRVRGQALNPKMGNLPAHRISIDYPFKSVGVDYAGPFFILNRKGRGAKLSKCYLCLFICLRFKCVHLEPVSDLTKESFIMTLRRFVARRGLPAEICSDNGRNFVAAAKEISHFLKNNSQSLSEFATGEGIKFSFIPAYSPHFGGIWEAGVKAAKYHIKRVMGNTHLTFEELCTLFAQVEAVLNSRPLCPMSSSPDDFLSLSPGHFLIGRPLNALPTPALDDCKATHLQRYARLEQIRRDFWNRWRREYISELQLRTKWKSNTTRLNIGDLVLLHEENVPPLSWRLGRVVQLFPGPDGIPRVADVRTSRGHVRRSLIRLCPLPTSDCLSSDFKVEA